MVTDTQLQLLELYFEEAKKARSGPPDEGEVLKALNFLLHDNRKLLEAAVDIISDGKDEIQDVSIKKFIANDEIVRTCWKVRGSQDREYTCLENYCSCPSFANQVKQGNERVLCKHLLAISIVTLLQSRFSTSIVSNEQFVDLLCNEKASANTNPNASSFRPYRNWRK